MHKLSCFINDKHTGKTVGCFFCLFLFTDSKGHECPHTDYRKLLWEEKMD